MVFTYRNLIFGTNSLLQRGIHEVSEDSIATITIDKIQRTLKEDLNIVYDALVASDYIEGITEA